MANKSVPPDGNISITDYGYRNWGPELVQYAIDAGAVDPDQATLLGDDGKPVPFQVDNGVLAFVATVPKGETVTYKLQRSPVSGDKAPSSLAAETINDMYEVRNEFLAVRLPAPEAVTFEEPIPAADAPPPILQWKPADGDWMGDARLHTERKVKAYEFSIVREGPACVEYEARYTLAPAATYLARIRMSPGMPLAVVTEEFDFGEITDGRDLLILDLHAGWQPDRIAWPGPVAEQQRPVLQTSDMNSYVEGKRKTQGADTPVGGVGEAPAPYAPDDSMVLLEKIVPGGRWGNMKGGIQVWQGTEQPIATKAAVGVVTLHVGSWRRALALNAWFQPNVGTVVTLPISVRYSRWSLDIADDHSPFSTHEHDKDLSRSYGRREWGLYVGDQLNEAQAIFGHIGLDRYKNWITDVPEAIGPDGQTVHSYPRAYITPQQLATMKGSLDEHLDKEYLLNQYYMFSGKTEDAVRHAQLVINRLKKPYPENDFYIAGLSNYRKSQMLQFAHYAEDALACPELPADLRQELRRRLTLYAYVTSDPDFNPRGAGVHLGNNNMTINRTLALTYFASLLPDHPLYDYWMQRARAYAHYKFATQTAPDGTWVACPSYQLYSPTRTLNISQIVLHNTGIEDFSKFGYHASTLRYLANLTMTDPRFENLRIIPGMGNSSNQHENVWGFAMAAVAHSDPEEAGWLRYMKRLADGRSPIHKSPNGHDSNTPHPLFYRPSIPEHQESLKTAFYPTYGVMFRNGFETANETGLLLRAGINWSHWDTDCLNVILYGKGAPLSPGTGYQYFSGPGPWQNNGIAHNQVKVGRRDLQEVFGRVDDTVTHYGFGAHADYARASRFYPSQLFQDGEGTMAWNRHITFVKTQSSDGTDYAVMRDTFENDESRGKWWNWMNLGNADKISVDGVPFEATEDYNAQVPPEQMPTKQGQTIEMATDFGASTLFWFAKPRDIRHRMTARYRRQDKLTLHEGNEIKTVIEVPAEPGEDFTYVVWPRRDDEAKPVCETLVAGIIRVQTPESVDIIFSADEAFDYQGNDLVFTGNAGTVRIYEDHVVLAMQAGSGQVGYKGYVLEGNAPFEQSVPLNALEQGVHRAGDDVVKEYVQKDIGNGMTISGETPFDAKYDGHVLRITTRGRARVLQVTKPASIVRPEYRVDGQEWMACWTDYPASGWGSYDRTWLMGLAVPEGEHELEVRNMTFPLIWQRPFTPLLKNSITAAEPR